jgi:diguanylate cyclase (GGDEF)-like protein
MWDRAAILDGRDQGLGKRLIRKAMIKGSIRRNRTYLAVPETGHGQGVACNRTPANAPSAWCARVRTLAYTALLAAFMATGVATLAQADSLTLRVGVYDNEPKVYIRSNGSPSGLFIELLERMADIEGWTLEYVPCLWAECLELLERGSIDLMPDVAASAARRDRFAFNTVPVALAWSQIYSVAIRDLLDLESLSGLRVSALQDSVQQHYLEHLDSSARLPIQIHPVESMADVLRAVRDGEADAAATNNFYGGRMAGRYGLLETPITFDHTSLHFAANGDADSNVLTRIDFHLQRWKADPASPYYAAMVNAVTPPTTQAAPGWLRPLAMAVLTGGILGLLAIFLLRGRVRDQAARLLRSGQHLEHLLTSSPVILYSLRGRDMHLDWVSGNIERILGFPRSAVMEPHWWEGQLHPEDRRAALRRSNRVLTQRHDTREYRIHDAEGRVRHIRDERRLIDSPNGNSQPVVIGSWTDLTELHERRQQLDYLSTHDPKTGLPNRNLLIDRLDQALKHARRKNTGVMVVLVDIDRFRHINDSLGTEAGDQVLTAVADRLDKACDNAATIARSGSDEFCVVLEIDADGQETRLVQDMHHALASPIRAADHDLVVSVSLGAALYPRDGQNRDTLLAAAELALESARRTGGDRVRFYEATLGEHTSRRLFLENELRHAIGRGELELYFQPQLRLADRSIQSVEALVRWNHPQRGLVAPADFIPLAEETGLIERIDRWVLEQACAQMAHWDAEGATVPKLAINLSPREFQDGSLVDLVDAALSRNGLTGDRLEVEITETMLMEFPEQALKVLRRLEALGVHLCMDDFGSGYSNLAFIRRLPLHRLKIDRSLIREVEHSRHNRLIIQAIIAMAEALELELVAEGIETEKQLDFLYRSGCRIGQGFLLGKPMPAADMVGATGFKSP